MTLATSAAVSACSSTSPTPTTTAQSDYERCYQAAANSHHGILPKSEAIRLQHEFACIQQDMMAQRHRLKEILHWHENGLSREQADERFVQALQAQVPITQSYVNRFRNLNFRNNEVDAVRQKLVISLDDFSAYTAASATRIANNDTAREAELIKNIETTGETAERSQAIALEAYRALLQKYKITWNQ